MICRRCSRCILSSTYSGIHFDADGVCNVCKGWDKRWRGRVFQGRDIAFREMFDGPDGKYDCVLPFSGGKDSSYVLDFLVRRLGLRPRAVNLNNHFQTDITSLTKPASRPPPPF